MSKINEKFVKAVLGIGSQQVLARECGVSQQTVSLWVNGGKMDVKHIPAIIKATNGAVKPEDLRPDVDWAVIRNS
ncbi:helix-turn-helix domain-containing protein [Aggregatibacter actinomycetemcomitans]|uniref:transcriptional regulator n=1 Tax=Aggregatibacter actinomycetemcomitans TaxID=714 RepID=UPI00197C3A19|nr:helix-turn-helix domain-containing protein [Aggregatibacter actinomycetemcomitans]MBN6074870.1 helix-turn-helix domain-containing protein [Aggregatibacter actinomycetemcomitans]MBN6077001.1 helix-turn-helix domain-containing protein [Aggregatibacter actinomycetemcomitans]